MPTLDAASFDASLRRTAERYARATDSPSQRHFTREKLKRDPAVRAVASLGPLGRVLDIGCGRGQLALLLLELGAADSVEGSDWDEAKVALGNRAAEGLSARFTTEDVSVGDVASRAADTVLLIDVLHYLDAAKQDALLEKAATLVRPGGRLVLREASLGFGVRSGITVFVENISRGISFNRGATITIRDVAADYVPILERAGLRCDVRPCWAGTPFANVLVVARRPLVG